MIHTDKNWYIISYDIRDAKRWRSIYKIVNGSGERLQYSIFRVYMNQKQLEKLRWRIEQIKKPEDDMLIVRLCGNCTQNIIDSNTQNWDIAPPKFEII